MAKKVHNLDATGIVVELVPYMKLVSNKETGEHYTKMQMSYSVRDEVESDRKKEEVNDDEVVFQTAQK